MNFITRRINYWLSEYLWLLNIVIILLICLIGNVHVLKVKDFFYLLDQMLMLFLYENKKEEIRCQTLFSAFKAYKSVQFHFQLGTIPHKTGEWG